MKNLATKNQTDFAVMENGEAFISQRKLAELCGVKQDSIYNFFLSRNIEVKQGVTAENAVLSVRFYAIESKAANAIARKTLAVIAEAGMKAYIYHEAGYTMKAEKPMSQLELMQNAVNELVRIDNEQRQQAERLTTLESAVGRLTSHSSYMAILAWAHHNNLKIPTSKAASMGKQAKAHCALKGIEVGHVNDERYGSIGTYPQEVLDLLFKPA